MLLGVVVDTEVRGACFLKTLENPPKAHSKYKAVGVEFFKFVGGYKWCCASWLLVQLGARAAMKNNAPGPGPGNNR